MVAEINWWFPGHSIEIVEIVNGVPVYVKKKEDLFSRVGESECYPNLSVCCDWKTEEDSLYETLDDALSHLDNKERRLICAKFGYDGKEMKLREMADENGVSVQAIHKRCNNTVSKLRTFFEGANSSYSMCA
jgi:DNA-directed RNA polymerase specialized sigma24 family protein